MMSSPDTITRNFAEVFAWTQLCQTFSIFCESMHRINPFDAILYPAKPYFSLELPRREFSGPLSPPQCKASVFGQVASSNLNPTNSSELVKQGDFLSASLLNIFIVAARCSSACRAGNRTHRRGRSVVRVVVPYSDRIDSQLLVFIRA
ncbi:hypothetical protein RB195_018630 [Necator americanus]|uniref:Uncharacterized protein n=1 Tax=Necator americanus TaxID=51031 RepID=A0ABR1CAL8_NECAM